MTRDDTVRHQHLRCCFISRWRRITRTSTAWRESMSSYWTQHVTVSALLPLIFICILMNVLLMIRSSSMKHWQQLSSVAQLPISLLLLWITWRSQIKSGNNIVSIFSVSYAKRFILAFHFWFKCLAVINGSSWKFLRTGLKKAKWSALEVLMYCICFTSFYLWPLNSS